MFCSIGDGFYSTEKEIFLHPAPFVENNYREDLSNAVKYCQMV